jgi:LacI family transcriptional regulator
VHDRKMKNVTLRDVAKRVGVSAMTVSRALSGKEHLVGADTAQRCREVADEMGYVPNLMARSLRGEQLNTIVMLAENISQHHYLARLVDEVSQAIEARQYGVISCQSLSSYRQALRNFKLAGALVIAPPEAFFRHSLADGRAASTGTPVVLIHSAVEQDCHHEVSPDIEQFSFPAAQHLVEHGHRHLGYLGGPTAEQEPTWFELRRRGIARALSAAGLPPGNICQEACAEPDRVTGALQKMLTLSPQTTGIICINDEIAISAIHCAPAIGKEVPRDLSIVGCNNIQLASLFRPSVTTIAIDIRSMVAAALDLLFEEIRRGGEAEDHRPPVKIKLPASLIGRLSTGPAPGR